jgi:hypothetical protein
MAIPEGGLSDWLLCHRDNEHNITLNRVRGVTSSALQAVISSARGLKTLQVIGSDLHEASARRLPWAMADDHNVVDGACLEAVLASSCSKCIVERQWRVSNEPEAAAFVAAMKARAAIAIVRAEFGAAIG